MEEKITEIRERSAVHRFTIKEKSTSFKVLGESPEDKDKKKISKMGNIDKQIRRGSTMQNNNISISPLKLRVQELRKNSIVMTSKQELINYLNMPHNDRKVKLSSIQKLIQSLSGIKQMFPVPPDQNKVGIEEISKNAKYIPIKKHQVLNMMSERIESNYYIITGKVACIQPVEIEVYLTKKEYLDYLLNLIRYSHMELFKACLSCNSSTYKIKESEFLNLLEKYFSYDYIYDNETDNKTTGEMNKLNLIAGTLLKKKSSIASTTYSLRNTRKANNNNFCGIVYDYLCNHYDEETKSLVIEPDYYLRTVNKKLQELCGEEFCHAHSSSKEGLTDLRSKVTLFELKIIETMEDNDIIGRFELDCEIYKPKSTYIALVPTETFSLKICKYKAILVSLYEKINKDNLNIILETGIFREINKNELSKNLHQLFSTINVRKGELYSTASEGNNIIDLDNELVIVKSGMFSLSMYSSIIKLQKIASKLSNNFEFSELLQEYMNNYDGMSKKDYLKPINLTIESLGNKEVVGIDEKFINQLQEAILKIKMQTGGISNKRKEEIQNNTLLTCESFIKTMELRLICNSANGELIIINKNSLTSNLESSHTLTLIMNNVIKILTDKKDYYVHRIKTTINSLSSIHCSENSPTNLISIMKAKLKSDVIYTLNRRKTKSQDYNGSSTLATLTESKVIGKGESKLKFDSSSLPLITSSENIKKYNDQSTSIAQDKEYQPTTITNIKFPMKQINKKSNIAELQAYLNRAKVTARPNFNFRSSFKDTNLAKTISSVEPAIAQRSYYFQNFTAVGNNKNN